MTLGTVRTALRALQSVCLRPNTCLACPIMYRRTANSRLGGNDLTVQEQDDVTAVMNLCSNGMAVGDQKFEKPGIISGLSRHLQNPARREVRSRSSLGHARLAAL